MHQISDDCFKVCDPVDSKHFTGTAVTCYVGKLCIIRKALLKGHCIEFKYYADGIHSGLTPPG